MKTTKTEALGERWAAWRCEEKRRRRRREKNQSSSSNSSNDGDSLLAGRFFGCSLAGVSLPVCRPYRVLPVVWLPRPMIPHRLG